MITTTLVDRTPKHKHKRCRPTPHHQAKRQQQQQQQLPGRQFNPWSANVEKDRMMKHLVCFQVSYQIWTGENDTTLSLCLSCCMHIDIVTTLIPYSRRRESNWQKCSHGWGAASRKHALTPWSRQYIHTKNGVVGFYFMTTPSFLRVP